MKSLLPKAPANPLKLAKNVVVAGFIASWAIMPELLWHKLGFILHVFYEVASFLLEEALIHGAGMQKYYAQMTVFYFFWLSGIVLFAFFLRRLPHLIQKLKAELHLFALRLKDRLIETWLASSLWQKIKFLSFQFALMAGGIVWLLI
ncbi:hypothetical protein [Methylomonas rivi]|uniref:Uncharacterized protein n=1 Tax=Methylomonas rivi TaxID=2952226 RepID=A0ABT1U313_9GAMM|nr:hypothetical protein [Methylomonas sp. WSC-6]MBS4050412.1 hypothetical protein [Methylomonas sp.]MCQ8128227.1 hypothetical protein [Methylomonas sp. WSC-6]